MACDDDNVVGVGRIQFNSASEAQIRYMAVAPEHESKGIGKQIITALEQAAIEKKITTIVLDAREPVVGFYEKLGYVTKGKSYLLFDSIQHYTMRKTL